jgi:lactoylglutathione lyase
MIDHVNAVVLPVRDVEKCAAFYRDKLGFKLNNKDDESAFFSIDGKKGGLVLGLVSISEVARLISEKQVRPDVDREYEDLKAKGVHFVKPPTTQPWGQQIAYFEDPEGNLWEISHFPKK